ncbi:hypothetical protein ACFV1L_26800, partial [Kitasatospora sp. NPDC059646]
MTTYAQAQETAEDWINAGVPRSLQREVRVREFDLGYVCWAVDGSEHEGGAGTSPRLVIARDSGASTLWPPLPVNEVVRQYEELYGTPAEPNPAGAAKPVRGAVEATSFLLSPPQWLQDAGAAAMAAEAAQLSAPAAPPAPPAAGPGEEGPSYFTGGGTPVPGTPVPPPPAGSEAATVLAAAAPFPPGGPSTPVPGTPVPPPPGPVPGAPAPHGAPPPVGATPPFPVGGPTTPVPGTPVPPPVGATPPFPVGGPSTPVPGTPVPPPGPVPAPSIDYAPTMLAGDGPPGLMGLPGAPGTPGHGVQLGRSGPTAPPPPPPNELLPPAGGPAQGGLG